MGFPSGTGGSAGDIRDMGSILGWGRSPGGGHGNPLQYSCLENPMDRGAQWAKVHGVSKSQTQLSDRALIHIDLVERCFLLALFFILFSPICSSLLGQLIPAQTHPF